MKKFQTRFVLAAVCALALAALVWAPVQKTTSANALPLSSDIAKKLGLKSATITSGSYPFSGGKAVFNARLVR